MMRRLMLVAVSCAVLALALTSCSGQRIYRNPGRAGVVLGSAPAVPPGSDRAGYDLPAVLVATTAYLASGTEVRVLDTSSGKTTATVRPRYPALPNATAHGRPLLLGAGAEQAVLWPFLVAGPNGKVLDLVRIDTNNHSARDTLLALPTWVANAESNPQARLIGVDGTTAVLDVSLGLRHGAVAADTSSGQLLWTRDNFTPGTVTAATVVGAEPDAAPALTAHLTGLSVGTGQPRWTHYTAAQFDLSPAGPTLVAADSPSLQAPDRRTIQLLDAATGGLVRTLPLHSLGSSRCLYDQDSVTVCVAPARPARGDRQAVALDARTGAQLWRMPNRTFVHDVTGDGNAPVITAAWHGQIYGSTEVGTTAYKARTGMPTAFLPGPSPMLVNDQVELAVTTNGTIIARAPKPLPDYVPPGISAG